MGVNIIVVKLPGGGEMRMPKDIDEFFESVMERTHEVASSTALVTLLANMAYDRYEEIIPGLDEFIKDWMKENLRMILQDQEPQFWSAMVFSIRNWIQSKIKTLE